MKIFKLFKEIQAIRDVLTLIFTQQIDLNHKLTTMQAQLDALQPEPYEEFEGESGDIRITTEVYKKMCEYLEEDEIELMGLT
jgi:hypothetical protein